MTNNTSHMINNQTTLKFGSEYITLSNTPKDQSIQFLGIWFSLHESCEFNIHKACQITFSTSQKLSFKRLTGDHVKYVTNRVIIPQLDFLLQCTVLKHSEHTKLMAPLRKVFKHKAHLGSTTSNNIIHAHSSYGLIDFEQHHLII